MKTDAELEGQRLRGAMRLQAWERAKGELRSILATYIHNAESYAEAKKLINEFIERGNDEGPWLG